MIAAALLRSTTFVLSKSLPLAARTNLSYGPLHLSFKWPLNPTSTAGHI